jgi:cytochrome c biogenesis protein
MRGINASYDQFGNFLSYLDVGEEYELNFHKFQIIEFIPITGLQIKLDPGITAIYFGFGLLMLSIFLSYRSFSQIWLNKEKNTIFVGGKTNRAQLSFEKEILDIILSLKNK